nr:MAM and LDL-receptor class A domain-containing protein 1-like isoform X2 [Misgurnus anguillicaudatus]
MTGPSSDHTTGSGFYMYIEGDSASYGDTARIISSECADIQNQCLQFWYHMYGSGNTMGLSVYHLQGNVAKEVWKKRENQGNMWYRALVDLTPTGKFQVIFEGRRGSTSLSDVSIDDVSLHKGTCDDLTDPLPPGPIPTTTRPTPTTTRPTEITTAPITTTTSGGGSAVCNLNCDFDGDICAWSQMPTDAFDWTRHTGSTPSLMTGPSSDHTTGSGFYMYIEGDSASYGDTARIISSECADIQNQCLQFWYHMYGSGNTMGLSVYHLQGNVAKEVWKKRENQGNMWYRALVDLTPTGKFQVIFEGRRGSTSLSDVSIDDVSLHKGTCDDLTDPLPPEPIQTTTRPTPTTTRHTEITTAPITTTTSGGGSAVCNLNCDFDGDICAWSQMPTDAFDWTRHTGSTPSLMTGPSSDHTTGSGFYMYIEGDSASYGDTARIISSECADIQNQCLQFWYHMYGSGNTMGLSVYHLQGNVAKEVWKKRENQGNMWYRALVDLTPTGKFQVIFEGRRGSTSLSDVSIDDVSLHKGTCDDLTDPLPPGPIPTTTRPTPTTTRPTEITTAPITTTTSGGGSAVCNLNCDFDGDICAWSQMPTDAFDWTRHTGSTPSLMTGPSSDHTTGSGFYMYIEGDSASYGDTARIISSECADIQNQCLQFWYHMYGSGNTMGLSVYHLQGNVAKEVWKKRENQGNMWYRALVDLTPTGKFQVIFEGRRGSTSLSDVSIDDVSLHKGTCDDLTDPLPPEPIQTTTRPTPTTTRHTEITTAPITTTTSGGGSAVCNLNCDFDGDICAWSQMPTDAFDWTRHTGSTPSLMTGPSSDHTTGSGFYMYIEGDSASYGDTARIISSECADIQNQCLQFWYHMYGSGNTMGLSVYHLQGNVAKEVWKKRENQGNMWYRALVDLTPTGKFQVIFEGRRGSTSLSDVSIDDVSLHKGTCDDLTDPLPPGPIPTTTRPTPTTTRPTEITTAPITTTTSGGGSAVCNLNCDFDGDICAWSQMPTDAFDWTRHTGSTPSLMTGPSSDHTTGSGFYMYIEGDSASYGDTARIISSECADIQNQCLQFWYHMYGSGNTMGLSVYHLQGNVAKEVWKKRENQGNTWYRALVDLTPTGKFQVIFEGRRGSTSLSDVSIDDVSLHKGTCDDLTDPLPPEPIQTTTRPTPTTTRHTEITTAPITTTTSGGGSAVCNLNCDFDGDICAWSQMPTDAFDWTRHTGSTPSLMTGPSSDHTTGSGFYMYIEGDSASYGDTARIISSECADIQNQCLQFWYHMYGSGNTMGLSVYHLQGNVAKEVWKKRENQGNMWYRALVDLTPTGKFQVIFEGRRGSTSLSDVSIDDVSLHKGTCDDLINPVSTSPPVSLPPTTSPCPKNSHYTDCIHTCQPTCSHLHGPPNCNTEEPCVPGCLCDDGFVLKQGVCVPIHKCGCVDSNGDIHDFGDVWYGGHCSQRCKCEYDDGGEIECEDHECDEDEICHMNEEGDYSCQDTEFSKCTIDDKPEFKTFDSMKHKFKGKESYVLAQSSGLPSNVPEVYVVSINKKTKGESSDEGMSSGMGRGKSSEEDNSSNKSSKEDSSSEENKSSKEDSSSEENKSSKEDSSSEENTSSKEDSSSEENKSSKEDSSSEEDNNNKGRIRVIRIRAYNRTVDFKKDLKITVDGLSVRPPISPTKGMKIYERSSRVFLKTDFGLTVEFNGKGRAEITLSHVYKKKIGGLCGNFDDSSKNDMMKPNGKQAKDVKEFGESWRLTDRRRRSAVLKKWLLR